MLKLPYICLPNCQLPNTAILVRPFTHNKDLFKFSLIQNGSAYRHLHRIGCLCILFGTAIKYRLPCLFLQKVDWDSITTKIRYHIIQQAYKSRIRMRRQTTTIALSLPSILPESCQQSLPQKIVSKYRNGFIYVKVTN